MTNQPTEDTVDILEVHLSYGKMTTVFATVDKVLQENTRLNIRLTDGVNTATFETCNVVYGNPTSD